LEPTLYQNTNVSISLYTLHLICHYQPDTNVSA